MLAKATGNDPSTQEIFTDCDERFKNIKPDIVVGFAESLRSNVNLRRIVIRGACLGNDFLSALSERISTIFMLEYVDLSQNSFTNDGLVDFCLGLADNKSLTFVDLTNQQSPIFTMREELVIDALSKNTFVKNFRVEFHTSVCSIAVASILIRNNKIKSDGIDYAQTLLDALEREATSAEKSLRDRKREAVERKICEADMTYLFELSETAAKFKFPYDSQDDLTASTLEKQLR